MVLHGERLDRPTYPVIQTIQEGSTALCYKAWHAIFQKFVVQKTVSLLGLDDALAYREPHLLDGLNHPNIVEIREAQWDPELTEVKAVTFTMPFYEGGSVYAQLVGGTKFSLGEAIDLCCQILSALTYLHNDRELLHRDVKPGNIFLSADLSVAYLGDLGSAAYKRDGGQVEARGGTLLYRPPEARSGAYDHRGDLYALGVTLFEMINGPFKYESIDLDEVEKRLTRGHRSMPARAFQSGPHVPEGLVRIISRMINVDPLERPSGASEVRRELQRVIHCDWRESPTANGQRWLGRRRDSRPGRPDRLIEITAQPISTGRYRGLVDFRAAWKPEGAEDWRGLPALRKRLQADGAGWRAFFKSVETAVPQR